MINKTIWGCRLAIISFLLLFGSESSMADIGDAEAVKNIPRTYCNDGNKLVIKDTFLMTEIFSIGEGNSIACTFVPKSNAGQVLGFGFSRIEAISNCNSSAKCAKEYTRRFLGYRTNRKIREKIVAGHTFFCAIKKEENIVHEYCNSFLNERRVWLELKSPKTDYDTDKLSKIFMEIE